MIVEYLLKTAIIKAKVGNRNQTGLWLACQLRDNGITQSESENIMLNYAKQVGENDTDKYTEEEALATLKSAFNRPARERGISSSGRPCQPVNPTPQQPQKGLTPELTALSTASLAEAKHLSSDFLKSLGITDYKYTGQPSVRIPYYDRNKSEAAVRFRISLGGNSRFRWRKGNKAIPYGLDRLDSVKESGWVIIVEGESDCWTCWYYDIPAIGIPGKTVWSPTWKEYLEGLEVYVWQEPEAEDFTARILSSIPDIRVIKAPENVKDISEACIQGIKIQEWLENLKAEAGYGRELIRLTSKEEIVKVYNEAREILESEEPLELIGQAIQGLGYGGDLKPAMITYLAVTSRLLEMRAGSMPVHLLLQGPPSSGKNYTLSRVLTLFPEESYHVIDAGSPRTLIYDSTELSYKALIYSEADSLPAGEDNPAASAIRSLLQDHHLSYEVTVRDHNSGEYIVRKVNKPGPTTLITTSTQSLGYQLMSRLFTLELSDSKEQITAALLKQAEVEETGINSPDSRMIAFQRYLQLKAPLHVIVPFATDLAQAIGKSATASRILRDFSRLLSLIKVIAVIRQHHRVIDSQGRITASTDDYEIVRDLVNEMYVDSSTGVTEEIRKLIETIESLISIKAERDKITNTAIAKALGIGVKQVTRRTRKAIRAGWLVNREQRKSYPADYELGEPLPDVKGLPLLSEVDTAEETGVNQLSLENDRVDTLTPSTIDNTPPYSEGWEDEI